MKLIFDVVSGQAKYRSTEEPTTQSALDNGSERSPDLKFPILQRRHRSRRNDPGVSRHFPGLSVKALGQLFDKYRITGRIDVHWNAETGQYDILFGRTLAKGRRDAGC